MDKECESIHDFDYRLICEYFLMLDRQGPGSEEMTLRALGFLTSLPDRPRILDIGCGTGSSALVLARNAAAQVTAIDLYPPFVERLRVRAAQAGVHVDARVADMCSLPHGEQYYDVVWCEGAIYYMGFREGLVAWRDLLNPGGYMVVSDAVWLAADRPAEVEEFWSNAYAGIDWPGRKFQLLSDEGYEPIACFVIPPSCWVDHYYRPQEAAQEMFLQRHQGVPLAEAFVANQRYEAALYNRYGHCYGYCFFVGRKC